MNLAYHMVEIRDFDHIRRSAVQTQWLHFDFYEAQQLSWFHSAFDSHEGFRFQLANNLT